jgi:hypothetical protein
MCGIPHNGHQQDTVIGCWLFYSDYSIVVKIFTVGRQVHLADASGMRWILDGLQAIVYLLTAVTLLVKLVSRKPKSRQKRKRR